MPLTHDNEGVDTLLGSQQGLVCAFDLKQGGTDYIDFRHIDISHPLPYYAIDFHALSFCDHGIIFWI